MQLWQEPVSNGSSDLLASLLRNKEKYMDLVEFINFALKVMALTGLSAGLAFIVLQLMIRKLERR